MTIADEIKRLHELHLSGALTDAEFALAKAKLLASIGGKDSSLTQSDSPSFSGLDKSFNELNRFRRSKSDQWLGGICGGLAKFTGLESWVWRLLFVLFALYFGFGLFAYILAWVFVPEES